VFAVNGGIESEVLVATSLGGKALRVKHLRGRLLAHLRFLELGEPPLFLSRTVLREAPG